MTSCITKSASTWIAKGGEIDSFGGGYLEHPRQWQGAQRLASSSECRAGLSHQAHPEEAQEPSPGTAKGPL